jgi:GH25 family lysozyme M1 (1,4-beta-N-acetylmuramidase)
LPASTTSHRRLLGSFAGLVLSLVVVSPVLAADPPAQLPPLNAGRDALILGRGLGIDGAPPSTQGPSARQGIDVSHYQGGIRWNLVADYGIDFAIAKATQGSWMIDEWYARNAYRARNHGIRFTAYHFAQPSRRAYSAVRQADFFLKQAALTPKDLVPALDMERSGGLDPKALRRWVLDWLHRVYTKTGVKAMVYSNPGFWSSAMGNTAAIARAGYEVLWVAHWNTLRPTVPARGWDGNGWTVWQWTECGHVPGVSTCVDRDAITGTLLKYLTIGYLRGLVKS